MLSYEGTIFDLPDEGLYFRDPPYVNQPVLEEQLGYAKQAMRRLLQNGFNTITFLNLNVEDYVNYDLLEDGKARVWARQPAPQTLGRLLPGAVGTGRLRSPVAHAIVPANL